MGKNPSRALSAFLLVLLALPAPAAEAPGRDRATDFQGRVGAAYALTGGRVLAAPGRVFDPGVVVVRGGVIEAVGPAGSTRVPADASAVDTTGKVVYAAFLDPYVSVDRLAGKSPKKPRDDDEAADTPRERGSRATQPAGPPVRAEARAVDALVVKDSVAETYRRLGFAVVAAVPASGVMRGRVAVVSLSEAPLSARVIDPQNGQVVSLEPPNEDEYPNSKMGAVAVARQAFRDALWWRDAEAAYAKQPSGRARPPRDASAEALVPAAEGKETVIFDVDDALALLRAERVAREAKVRARYVGGNDEYRLLAEVAASKPDMVLRVNFPRPQKLESEEEWLDVPLEKLRAFDGASSNPRWLKDAGITFSFTTAGLDDPKDFSKRVREAIVRGLSREDALAAVTTVPARQLGLADRLGTLEAGKIASLVVATGEPFAEKARVAEIWIDGSRIEPLATEDREEAGKVAASPHPAPITPADAAGVPYERGPAFGGRVPPGEGGGTLKREAGPVAAPAAVVVRNATIWTQGGAGILENADLIVSGGKVVAVGKNVAAPAGALEIDGRGKHVTPGIIDAHSHTGVDGDVNEGTHNVTAEVRIRDVLNPLDVAIYRELAGGTTVANILHGSANAIGGQTQIAKWRWGGGPDDLLFVGAPEGIKFALGENPKQANWRNPQPRYPRTRMGVAELIRERFQAARDYRRRQEEYGKAAGVKGGSSIPPRPDLQLEAIAEILEGKRQIHCHSYRKDEILQMIRTAEDFGVKVATFQHVLEGYKIADEIARHGAGASGFSDWWTYKYEVIDAIPYAFPLMRERGVTVSFNSDSDELARRLNIEAAKAVKYGNVPPADALAFVTSNPAKQLGIADRVGSLEAGKDGDFVIWSGDPLATTSVALETWIEGKKYFDRAADLAARPALETERADLVAKAKARLSEDKDKDTKDAAKPKSEVER
jgi:imidazolonepropionase-like amidohydrolase